MSNTYELGETSTGELEAMVRLLNQELASRKAGHRGVDVYDTYKLKEKSDDEVRDFLEAVKKELEKRGGGGQFPPQQQYQQQQQTDKPNPADQLKSFLDIVGSDPDVLRQFAHLLSQQADRVQTQPSQPYQPAGRFPAPVPKTGQTRCWNRDYQEVDCHQCDLPGQDGAWAEHTGEPWNRPRFTSNGDGTVTDKLTKLVWLENVGTFGDVTWEQARILAAKLHSGSHGLSDGSQEGQWRLPTIRELFSIIDYGQSAPIVPLDFPARDTVKPAIYWSSTTLEADPTQAWMMTLGIGPTVFMIKTTPNRMWPVRSQNPTAVPNVPQTGQRRTFGIERTGQDGALGNQWGIGLNAGEARFLVDENGKGTVTDALTGLVWLRHANPWGWQTWNSALYLCDNLCSGTVVGEQVKVTLEDGSSPHQWRLPNVREIESLVDYGRIGPCLPDGWREAFEPEQHTPVGSTVQPSSYWTSTTVAGAPSQAMFIILGVGPVIFENKEHPFFVWPVRNRI